MFIAVAFCCPAMLHNMDGYVRLAQFGRYCHQICIICNSGKHPVMLQITRRTCLSLRQGFSLVY